MRCEEIGTLLEAFVDGELSAEQSDAVEAHCRDCEACGKLLAERRVLRKLARASLTVDLPRDLRQQILDAAAAGSSGRDGNEAPERRSAPNIVRLPFAQARFWVPAVGLAAVLAIVLLGDRGPGPRDENDPFARPATVLPYRQGEAAEPASELEAGTLSLPGSLI